MEQRRLGDGPTVSVIGFGAFKIGRNESIKYDLGYALPDEAEAARLLHAVLDLGVTLIDTAPAYGLSEQRIGNALADRRRQFTLSTKVGETFEAGHSTFDFTSPGIERSVERSLRRLRTDVVDLLLLHSDGRDEWVLNQTDAVSTLVDLKRRGLARQIGLSGKTVEGARAALAWADVLMVEYHAQDRSHESVMAEAAQKGVGIVVKKALASGRLEPPEALRLALSGPGVCSAVVGTLSADHLRSNIQSLA